MTGLDYVHTKFQRSLDTLQRFTHQTLCGPNESLAIVPAPFSFPNTSRDYMCRRIEGDWLVMLDADMTHAPDTICRLLAAQKQVEQEHGECGVMTGIYPRRHVPPDTILLHRYDEKLKLWQEFEPSEVCSSMPAKADAAGAGAMLIMRWVIERIVTEQRVGPFSVWGPLTRDSFDEPLGAGTDDLAFCRRLQVLDPPVQLWYTASVAPGHVAPQAITLYDWLRAKGREKRVDVRPEPVA